MLIVGLTGGAGTGKTTVAGMFAQLGAEVIDADSIAHRAVARDGGCTKAVIETFGSEFAGTDGLNRAKLAKLVFHDVEQLRRLEEILHPYIRASIIKTLKGFRKKETEVKIVIIDMPLLFESGMDDLTDIDIVVTAARAQQIDRAAQRMQTTKADIQRRIRAQMPLKEKIRLADLKIDNSGSLKQTKKEVGELWQKLLQKVKTKK